MGTCQMHSSLSTIGLGSVFFLNCFHHLHLQPSLRLCSQHFLFNFDMTLLAKLCERLMSIGFKFEHSSWSSGYQMDLNDIIGAGPNSQIGHTFNTSKHLEVPRLNWNLGLAFGLAGFPSHQQHLRTLLIGAYVEVPNSQSIFGDIFHHRDPYRILKYWMPKVVFPPPPRSSMSPGPDSQSNLQTLARYGVLIPGVARILSKPVWGPPGRIMYEVTRFDTPNFLMASGTSTTKSTSEELSPKPFTEEPKA